MPLFYFHICDGVTFAQDEEGQEVADAAMARRTAIEAARRIMADELRGGNLNLASFIEVEDHDHALLFIVSFADAVTVNGVSSRADGVPRS